MTRMAEEVARVTGCTVGPFCTGLVHACEVECSYTMAVCPEMVKKEDLVDVGLGNSWVNP